MTYPVTNNEKWLQRLAELARQGVPRKEAVRIADEEFPNENDSSPCGICAQPRNSHKAEHEWEPW
jgi:hypothetical protein